ncbi:MAG: bacillithiol biosynthesis cysteine-adding enzyme BshC [Ignavibacteriales bacterium]|nr:bacillithiol biosynthesis cysteine-adding enzyme BshC [Ignavibacteriales bacterium]
MFVNFKDIPGHTKLFLDYLYNFEKINKFYARNPYDKETYSKAFEEIASKRPVSRANLEALIRNQYSGKTYSTKTQKNIELLAKDSTLTIVTGQQLGILGGPLYTFNKIITTIKLANHLKERFDSFNFVPVFWLEGDDHDFNEVRNINIIDNSNELKKISYGEEIPEDEINPSVGQINLDDKINSFLLDLEQHLRQTEFTPELMKQIKNFYTSGKTFKKSFEELIHLFFDQHGLIIFDPQDNEVKNYLRPVYKKELLEYRNRSEESIRVSAELDETYHAQVKIKPINLFLNYENGRHALEPDDEDFKLKRKRKRFTKDELLNLVETTPQIFSPNVLFRPVCQDYILPTAFYIGGPSEIAYFAQVMPLYKFFNVPPPFIYPRSSATLLEKGLSNALDKFNLQINEIFSDPEAVKQKIIKSIDETPLEDFFISAVKETELIFDTLKEKLFSIDKTTSDSVQRYREKSLNNIEELKSKSLQAQRKKYEVSLKQIDKLISILFPNENLQERELNFIYFANKYGPEFFRKIFDELQINKFEHQIIEI